ncbi:MAG: hypothetical protein RIR95_96 [Pseudomonadota bacterium]
MLLETIGQRDPVALLVDAENISHSFAQALLDQAYLFGVPTVRRAYGKSSSIEGWEEYGYRLMPTRPGRNSADLLLCTQAMALALKEQFHTLLIASSDGGFAYLAEQLRELGHEVIGFGGTQAPAHYRRTCTQFVELQLAKAAMAVVPRIESSAQPNTTTVASVLPSTKLIPLIRDVLAQSSFEGKWGYLRWVEARLKQQDRNFSAENYGHKSLEDLVRGGKYFRIETVGSKVRIQDPNPKRCKTAPPEQPLATVNANDGVYFTLPLPQILPLS